MPCCTQPRSKASEWNSGPLSTNTSPGRPWHGQSASTPSLRRQAALSSAAWTRQRPATVADGASNERCKPGMQRLWTSMATVSQGRPIGLRQVSSTSTRSTGVWSICSTAMGRAAAGVWPAAEARRRAAALPAPSRARAARSARTRRTRARTVLAAGGFSPAVRQRSRTARTTASARFFCRVRYSSRIASATTRSTAAGIRPLPRPPGDGRGASATAEPPDVRQRRSRA